MDALKLLIAIPAYNEEQSIVSIIERCLEAKERIKKEAGIREVDITVVSDGSTDRTVELASRYQGKIQVIVFPKNRGYGAAIKEAWKQSKAEFLGFIDADGTCDPDFFGNLCREIQRQRADVILGCRMHLKSKMPLIRRIGNAIYAVILTALSSSFIRDTASGMRVVRRSALQELMPLPNGLHFTPAMSARAILSGNLKIVEIDMPYQEREGRSKLRIWNDGVRFLRVILESAFLYQPAVFFIAAGILCFCYSIYLMVLPSFFYLQHQRLEEWMIYRFIVGNLMLVAACLLLCSAHIGRKMVCITVSNRGWSDKNKGWTAAFFSSRFFFIFPLGLLAAGAVMVFPSAVQLLTTGATNLHWSRFMIMSLFYLVALLLSVTRLLDYVLDLIAARITYLKSRKHFD